MLRVKGFDTSAKTECLVVKAPAQNPISTSTRGTGFDTSTKKDSAADLPPLFRMLKASMTSKGLGYFKKPFKIRITAAYNDTSGANASLATVRNLKPGDATEWSALSGLFDEARCTGVQIHTIVTAGAAAIPSGTVVDWGCAFDPADSAAYSSVTGLLPSAHHIGPFRIWPQVPLQGVVSTYKDGQYTKWGFPLNSQPTLTPGISAEIVGGGWFGTGDSGVIVGFLKPYVLAAGAGVTVTISHYVTYDMEYRTRT